MERRRRAQNVNVEESDEQSNHESSEENESESDNSTRPKARSRRSKSSARKARSQPQAKKRSRKNESDEESESRATKSKRKVRKNNSEDEMHSPRTKPNKRTKKSKSDSESQSGRESESDDEDDNKISDADDQNSDEEDETQSAKKPRPKSSLLTMPSRKRTVATGSIKDLNRLERLDEARRAYKWWEAEELPNGLNWRKLEHPGIVFAVPYVKHNVPLLYDGTPVELNAEQEEIATFFAAMPEDGPQLGNPKTKEVFCKNFFHDFKTSLPPGHVIKKMSSCNFSQIKAHLDLQRSIKKAASEEEKAAAKREKERIALKHSYALIDGRLEKVKYIFL
jgi:DNA topoisomerase I